MKITIGKNTVAMWVALSALLLAFVGSPLVASAHAKVVSSTPADGATVAAGLTSVVINFDDDLNLDQSSATLLQAGAPVSGVTATVDRANRKMMTVQAAALTPGKYAVNWKAVSEDDNGITNGTINFTVSEAAGSPDAGQSTTQATPLASGGTGSSPLPATGCGTSGSVYALLAISVMVLAGGVLIRKRTAFMG